MMRTADSKHNRTSKIRVDMVLMRTHRVMGEIGVGNGARVLVTARSADDVRLADCCPARRSELICLRVGGGGVVVMGDVFIR
jgi:hypothetical protein